METLSLDIAPVEAGPGEPPAAAPESTSFAQAETLPEEGPALPSDLSTEDVPNDEPAEVLSSVDEPEETPRDWESELAELASERDSLTAERDDLSSRHLDVESCVNDLEEQNTVLLAEIESLKARLLDETLSSVQAELGTKISEPHMPFVNKTALVDENGFPDRQAVKRFVELFSVRRFEKAASDLHVGAQTSSYRLDPHAGFEGRNPYTGRGGSQLDARNRNKFNPFNRKGN